MYLHEFQFQILSHIIVLYNSEKSCDYVSWGIAQIIELLQTRTCIIKSPLQNMAHHIFHMQRMRLITYLKVNQKKVMRIFYIDAVMIRIDSDKAILVTLKTFSWFTKRNPVNVACKLFNACRMSPSAVKMVASSPSGIYGTFS